MTDRVTVDVQAHVAEITLNRPDKHNSLDLDMFAALGAAADQVAKERSVRAVVLCGAGDSFCAGIDLGVLQTGGAELAEALLRTVGPSPANVFQRAAYAWRELPVPVICALHGVAFGGGFQVAMGADLRIAAPGTRFSIMESRWGLIPDMAISTTLRGLVPPDRVKELAWTAREFDAAEALDMGIVSRISEAPLNDARTLAGELADRSPDAVRGIKRLVNEGWVLPDPEALVLEARVQLDVLRGANQREAVRANLEKRKPEFTD